MKLSNDYSPFGKFSEQTHQIGIVLIVLCMLPFAIYSFATFDIPRNFLLLGFEVIPFIFQQWSFHKQTRELKKEWKEKYGYET